MELDAEAIRAVYERHSLGSPDNAVGFVLWRAMHRYQREMERALRPHDLTHLQFTTLAMVGWMCRSGEPATQAELARRADIHPMQVSLMLKALEAKEMISRERATRDTRTLLVGITMKGLEALQMAFPVVIDIQRSMFGAAGDPGGTLLRELRKIEQPDE